MLSISVITVCLNAALTIRETIESVARAGEGVSQFVIVDGGSTDGTLDIIREAKREFGDRLTWVSEPDEGLYFAMNKGIEMATGSHVLFLGGDDALAEGAIESLMSIEGAQDADLIFGDVRVVDGRGATHVERGCASPKRVGHLPKSMPACHQASLYSLRALRKLGGFDTTYRIAADYDLFLRFAEAGLEALYVPVVIAEFRLGGASTRLGVATAREYRRVWVAHGVTSWIATPRMMRSIVNLYANRVLKALRGKGSEA